MSRKQRWLRIILREPPNIYIFVFLNALASTFTSPDILTLRRHDHDHDHQHCMVRNFGFHEQFV